MARIRSRRIEQIKIPRTREALHHPVGADFPSDTGIATIDRRVFARNSETARKIARSPALRESIERLLAKHEDEIRKFFAQHEGDMEETFKFTYLPDPKDPPTKFLLERDGWDLTLGFLEVLLSYNLEVEVRRGWDRRLTIPRLTATGRVEDLYDWNFYAGDEMEMFATIQFAWRSPPFPRAGRIFEIHVEFEAGFNNFPFPPEGR